MTSTQIAHLQYLIDVLENVQTDILVYMDDPEELEFLEIDRLNASIALKLYMRELIK